MQIAVLDRVDLYGLMTDALIQPPHVYSNKLSKYFCRNFNGTFVQKTPVYYMQIYSPANGFSIYIKERESPNEVWKATWKLEIPKND